MRLYAFFVKMEFIKSSHGKPLLKSHVALSWCTPKFLFTYCCLKQHQLITIIRNGIDVPLPGRQLLQRERASRVGKDSFERQCLRVAKPKTRSESHEQMQQNGGLQVIQFNEL